MSRWIQSACATLAAVAAILTAGGAVGATYVAEATVSGESRTRTGDRPVSASANGTGGQSLARAGQRDRLQVTASTRDRFDASARAALTEEWRIVGAAGAVPLDVPLEGSVAGRGDFTAGAAFFLTQGTFATGDGRTFSLPTGGSDLAFSGFQTIELLANTNFLLRFEAFVAPERGAASVILRLPTLRLPTAYADRYQLVRVDDLPPGHGGVPEPATWALLVLGFAACGARLRRSGPCVAARCAPAGASSHYGRTTAGADTRARRRTSIRAASCGDDRQRAK